jgi:hypothetical protein
MAAARTPRYRWVFAGLIAGVTALAAALRLSSLAAQSFSPAETAYVLAARESAWNLHGLLLRAAAGWFGSSDALLRMPSAIAGIATVPLLYDLLRRLARREVALAGAALLAIAPLHVATSQDARPFALGVLLCAGAALAVVRAIGQARVERWSARAVELRRSRRALALAACAAIVPVAAAALASAAWRPAKADFRSAVADVESRVRAEDLLLFDGAPSELAYLRYALRADDRLRLDSASRGSVAAALSGRARAWLVLSDVRGEAAARRAFPAGWREVDRLHARGVQTVLLERGGDAVVRRPDRAGGE